jgi:hypothetical protein
VMEAVSTSETSVNFYQTTLCKISEDTHLHSWKYFVNTWLKFEVHENREFLNTLSYYQLFKDSAPWS